MSATPANGGVINTNAEIQSVTFPGKVDINGLAQFFGTNTLLAGANITASNGQVSSLLSFHQQPQSDRIPLNVVNALTISQGAQLNLVITQPLLSTGTVTVEVARYGSITGSFGSIWAQIQSVGQQRNTLQSAQHCAVSGQPTTTNNLGVLFVNVPVSCEKEGLSLSAIIGIAVGGVCLLAIIVIVIVGITVRNRKKKRDRDERNMLLVGDSQQEFQSFDKY